MPSSADPVAQALESAAAEVATAIAACAAERPVVLVDGRSGAGKSTLARALAASWPRREPVELIALDSLYPGWDGLAAGIAYTVETILTPHARGVHARWQRWDWARATRSDVEEVPVDTALIIEGSGLLTTATAPFGHVRVWLESPTASRRHRALERDGDAYRPHWDRWAAQEERHLEVDDPVRLATHVFEIP